MNYSEVFKDLLKLAGLNGINVTFTCHSFSILKENYVLRITCEKGVDNIFQEIEISNGDNESTGKAAEKAIIRSLDKKKMLTFKDYWSEFKNVSEVAAMLGYTVNFTESPFSFSIHNQGKEIYKVVKEYAEFSDLEHMRRETYSKIYSL